MIRSYQQTAAEKLNEVDPSFGIDAITLAAEDITPLQTSQIGFDGHAEAIATEEFACLLDTLGNRLGADRIWRLTPHASHQPERRERRSTPTIAFVTGWANGPTITRPIRLLQRPEPIEVTAMLPDHPPTRFRWRRVMHQVRSATGPERIAGAWWHKQDPSAKFNHTRDYYRVEDEEGGRFWIFRTGQHGDDGPPTWYLHGLFP